VTDRSGLGVVDLAVMETLDAMGAGADGSYRKSGIVLDELDTRFGIGPGYGYPFICHLCRPWTVHLRIVEFHGNVGSLDFPAASPRYTEMRQSGIGQLALAAERGESGAVPVGLINGNVYCGGRRPPFDPKRVTDTLLALVDHPKISAPDLVNMIGPPAFPTRCSVDGDLDALAAGEPAVLTLTARLSPTPRGWAADRLPPGVSSSQIHERVAERVNARPWSAQHPELDRQARIPLARIEDLSTGDRTRLVFTAAPGADLNELRDRLLWVHGLSIAVSVQLAAPLPELLRSWVRTHRHDNLHASLRNLADLRPTTWPGPTSEEPDTGPSH